MMKFRSRSQQDEPELPNTVIGVGSSVRGTLIVSGTLRIDGEFGAPSVFIPLSLSPPQPPAAPLPAGEKKPTLSLPTPSSSSRTFLKSFLCLSALQKSMRRRYCPKSESRRAEQPAGRVRGSSGVGGGGGGGEEGEDNGDDGADDGEEEAEEAEEEGESSSATAGCPRLAFALRAPERPRRRWSKSCQRPRSSSR